MNTHTFNHNFQSSGKAEIQDLTVCIVINGEKFRSATVNLTMVQQCRISNLSKIFSFTTMHSSFSFLHQLFFSYRAKHRRTGSELVANLKNRIWGLEECM